MNPATLEPLATVAACGAREVAAAVRAARVALGPWCGRTVGERAALLASAGERMLARAAELARIQAGETGQAWRECLDLTRAAAACLGGTATAAADPMRMATPAQTPRAGVTAVLVAPQYPVLSWACMIAPWLVRGSTLVCAVRRDCPLGVLAAARCVELPPGVLNILAVDDATAGCLACHPGVDCTVPVGPRRPSLPGECIFVSALADLDIAVAGAASLRLFHSGQRRGQSPLIHVERDLAGAFASRMHEYLATLECGDPQRPLTDLGPLASHVALQRAADRVAHTLRDGAQLVLGGRSYQPWGLIGYFLQPTVLVARADGAGIPADELAGPVVIISPVDCLAAAVRQRMDGGCARLHFTVFTDDLERQLRSLAAAGLEAEVTEYASPVDRVRIDIEGWPASVPAPDGHRIELAQVTERAGHWFPYGAGPRA